MPPGASPGWLTLAGADELFDEPGVAGCIVSRYSAQFTGRRPALKHRSPVLVLMAALVVGCAPVPSPSPSAGVTAAPSPSPLARTRLVIDTDMAPDDVVAIASLLRDPGVEVLAILVDGTGEAHCQGGMFVARSVVTMLLDRAIPVTCGRATPIGDAEPFPDEWRAGADTGNGIRLISPTYAPDPRPAPDLLVELAAAEAALGERLTILTTGTLTNIASALELDPDLPEKVRMVSMLGALDVAGNVSTQGVTKPTAEWNAHADPSAVAMVLAAGFDLTLIPLDATNDVPLTRQLFTALEADHAAGPADLVYEIWARNRFMVEGGFHLWDPLASVALRDPSIVTTRAARIRVVEGAAADGGRLLEDPAGAEVTMATSADRGRFEAFLLAALRIGEPRPDPFAPVGKVRVVLSEGTCEVSFEPDPLPSGLIQLELRSSIDQPASTLVFGLAGIAWSTIEAFAKAPDFEHPPPVHEIAAADLEAAGSSSAWGDASAGPIGVACAVGPFDRPSITLRGPFDLAR